MALFCALYRYGMAVRPCLCPDFSLSSACRFRLASRRRHYLHRRRHHLWFETSFIQCPSQRLRFTWNLPCIHYAWKCLPLYPHVLLHLYPANLTAGYFAYESSFYNNIIFLSKIHQGKFFFPCKLLNRILPAHRFFFRRISLIINQFHRPSPHYVLSDVSPPRLSTPYKVYHPHTLPYMYSSWFSSFTYRSTASALQELFLFDSYICKG